MSNPQGAYNRTRATTSSHDWFKYKDIKKQCQHKCCKCFNQYASILIDLNSNAISKHLWSYIKSKKLDHTGVGTLKHQGSTYTNSQDKAQLLADYFKSVFTQNDRCNIPVLNNIDALPSIPQILVHIDGVAQHQNEQS